MLDFISAFQFLRMDNYVALSHATFPHNIKILLPDDAEESVTTNVVYNEVLID